MGNGSREIVVLDLVPEDEPHVLQRTVGRLRIHEKYEDSRHDTESEQHEVISSVDGREQWRGDEGNDEIADPVGRDRERDALGPGSQGKDFRAQEIRSGAPPWHIHKQNVRVSRDNQLT